ncbi:cytochrome P450 2K1-like isoform X2 [Toxotes jaculatrix]|uniref:cytochrome P450 2K1-like isoform X2 n=1 Tax=Toxotes jaculatrix TaxID=941984 RepID=UPI001B3B03DD|nr:cytochrome P450 2K1-like isoform X2 [Toxotes jaculatrix]
MGMFDAFLQSSSSVSLLGALVVLLLVYLVSTFSFGSQENGMDPPGPKPLPLLGNLLQLDLERPYNTLLDLSKKYGSVFTVYFGHKKVVVLAGYKTVKEALVNYADAFGEREPIQIVTEFNRGQGVLWSNGDSWKEMRRFALTNLRDFGMGKKACEDKIIEECDYLTEVFKKFKGEAFDTTQPINYAVSNIICSIVYGSRFEYDDSEFTSLVDRTNRNIQLVGSPSIQVYNLFPWIGKWFRERKEIQTLLFANRKQNLRLFSRLKETLNPQMCRGFVDAFLVRKQNLETSSSVSILGALVVLLLIYLVSSSSFSSPEDRKEPPGPRPLPLLGNLLQMDFKRPYNTLLKLSKKYGSVFTVYFGPKKAVVLAGYKTVKEALVNYGEEFGERDPILIMQEASQGQGVLWSNGDSWKDMRRFALTKLRDYGMGKKACEDKISEECDYLTEVFKKFRGEAFDTTKPMHYAVSNIICSMVYGSRFEYDDPEFTSLVDRTNRNNQLAGSPSIQLYNMFPWIGKWIANRKEFHKLADANKKRNLQLFSRLKETLNPQMCRGFVDAFLVRQQHLEKSEITNSHFHNQNLLMTVIHLFAAGTDTTATTLRWALLLMAKYPKIQDQVQEELTKVIGSRRVRVEDRRNLPFTDAVIHETQRLANILPIAVPHKTSQDVTFQGHFIKKGTTVYPLLTSVLYDESEWERPHTFYPAHFLDKDGNFAKRDAFMPFSAGRRACLGEGLARMELFIFFTTLLQRFRFTPPPGVSEDELDLTPRAGLSLSPSPHKLCAVPCA